MRLKRNFEIVEVAGEHLAIAMGDSAGMFNGVVALSDAAAYLLEQMNVPRSKEDLIRILTEEYEVEASQAQLDIDSLIRDLYRIGLIED